MKKYYLNYENITYFVMNLNERSDPHEIGDLCWDCFNRLGKCGKPNEKSEYTVLSAIVYEYIDKKVKKVVALSTGTKCYPKNIRHDNNDGIVDCHSESLLKRAFKRHIISDGFKIDENIIITLFISQLPCGCCQRWKGNQHSIGINRKPGRGLLCPKPSCIQKIAKWNCLGLQGKHLIGLTKAPLYINNIVIGNCGQIGEYDQQMFENMLSLNDNNCVTFNPFVLNRLPCVKFLQQFRNDLFVKMESKRSSSTAIVMWLEGNDQIVTEVVTEGRKHGLTKKNMANHQLLISDYSINRDIELIQIAKDNDLIDNYESQWNALKKCALFKEWPLYSLPQ